EVQWLDEVSVVIYRCVGSAFASPRRPLAPDRCASHERAATSPRPSSPRSTPRWIGFARCCGDAPRCLAKRRQGAARSPRAGQCFAEGTSWQEIGPDFFQPSRRSHVRGWYTTSGSEVWGPRHKNGSSAYGAYSAQPGNIAAVENQSIFQSRIGRARSSWCFLQL